jgi:hypothetical protein
MPTATTSAASAFPKRRCHSAPAPTATPACRSDTRWAVRTVCSARSSQAFTGSIPAQSPGSSWRARLTLNSSKREARTALCSLVPSFLQGHGGVGCVPGQRPLWYCVCPPVAFDRIRELYPRCAICNHGCAWLGTSGISIAQRREGSGPVSDALRRSTAALRSSAALRVWTEAVLLAAVGRVGAARGSDRPTVADGRLSARAVI